MGRASFSHGASTVSKSEEYSHGSDFSIQVCIASPVIIHSLTVSMLRLMWWTLQAAASSEALVNQRADPEPARSAHSGLSSRSDYVSTW